MSVYKELDLNVLELQDTVRLTRNAHHNTPYKDVDPGEAEMEQRQVLATKLLRMGWIPPVYADVMKRHLRDGKSNEAVALLCDVLGVDPLTLPEPLAVAS